MRNEELLKDIGQACAELRRSIGLTQQDIANVLGYSKENISAFENGRNGNLVIYKTYMYLADEYRRLLKEVNNYDG